MPIFLNFNGSILEVGGGNNPLRGGNGEKISVNMDVSDSPLVDVRHDASVYPWPFNAETFDNVYSAYCLEHVSWRDVRKYIAEIYRVLKKGGNAVLFTPNTLEQCKWVIEHGGGDEEASKMLFGGQEFPNHAGAHKNFLSPEWAKRLFEEAGFMDVKIIPHPATPTDMIIQVRKKGA